jgi:DNA-3-methyladenine glycosylase I
LDIVWYGPLNLQPPDKEKQLERCDWSTNDPEYIKYHDTEWGVPVHDDGKLFEFLILEGAQAGLSWITILKRREGYKNAFAGFDPEKIARFTPERIEEILKDPGIIRNKLKVNSAVTNARAFLKIQEEFGSFDHYAWGFVNGRQKVNAFTCMNQIPATSGESDAFSKDLKQRGFKFTGSTIIYAYMQATGMVNDHLVSCFRYHEVMET